jgi:hypothetical protein
MKRLKINCTPIITTIFLLLSGHGVWGQGSESFENSALTTSYSIGNFIGDNGIQWNYVGSRDQSTYAITNKGIMFEGATTAKLTSANISGGIGSFSCELKKAFTGAGNRQVELFINGVSKGTSIAWDNTTIQTFNISNINISGNVVIEIRNKLTKQLVIDNISWTGYSPTPTWTGATSTDWNTASNWNPATVPTSNDNVIIPSSGITNFPVATSLTIASGSTMTLNSNARLTVNGTLTNNGTLTLESGATLVQGTGNTASGSGVYNVQQALTGAGGATPSGRFWYMGSPLSGATSTAFDAAGDNRLWTYAEATQSYSEITANGVAMSPIQGHVARLGASSTINFTGGVLNSGDFTNSTLTNTGTGSTRGYTLISNPYPSFLDWNLISAGATGIATSLWYRTNDGSSMVYDTYNATGGISTLNSGVSTNPRYIPPMQAFWVYNPTDGTTGSLTISNNMRSHQTNGGLKDATDFPAFVRLNLENDGAIDQTVLYFDNNAAAGYDNFDSDKMMVSNAAQVYTLVGNKKLAINGMKSIKANKQVPLTVEFPTAKAYSFNATEVAMFDGIVLLEDRLKKVFQDLTMNPVYEFVADAGATSDRFVVHFQANSGVAGIESVADNGIAIVSNATGLVTISLSEELPAMGTIQIIDINGKVIATQAINEQTTTMNINAATGVYHVLVHSATKVARKKIVITK